MTQPDPDRRPIFSFLWPIRPRSVSSPVTHETKFLRLGRRGALRLVTLTALAMLIVVGAGSVILAGVTSSISFWTLPIAAGVATSCVVLGRGAIAGTYVNDEGIAVRTITRSRFIPWAQSQVEMVDEVIVVREDGRSHPTHVRRWSPDWPWGGEPFNIAVLGMRSWARAHHAWMTDPTP